MMKYLFLLSTLLFSAGLLAQDCYSTFLNKGVEAFNSLDFESALNQFEAAKICDDAPGDNEVNDWITKTQSGYIDAIKAARDEALQLKSEAIALRFFVKGQEREFKGFYLEAMDNYDDCVVEQPKDTLFRERRAQLAMSEKVAQFEKAVADLEFLLENGNPQKKSEYNDDLAYALEQLNDFDGAIVAQTRAAEVGTNEQKRIYNSKVQLLESKNPKSNDGTFRSDPLPKSEAAFIRVNRQKGYANCTLNIRLKIDGKSLPMSNGQISLQGIKPGTYPYEITGDVSCNGSPNWPAIGKGTLIVRDDTVYYLYWEKTKYGNCDMWINNY